MSDKVKFKLDFKPVIAFDDGEDIVLYYNDKESGKKRAKRIKNFAWYFCVKTKDLSSSKRSSLNRTIRTMNENLYYDTINIRIEESGDFTKIYCKRKVWFTLKNVFKRLNITTYEADLSLTKRFMIDNLIEVEEDLTMLFFDIETDDTESGIVIGRSRILSWACCDGKTGETFYSANTSEKELIKELLTLFNKYDLIIGWNSKQFDIPYIQARIDKINSEGNTKFPDAKNVFWKKTIHIDMMQRLIKLFGPMMSIVGLTGFSLDEVSRIFLGENKVEHEEKIIDLYNNNPEKLKKYNIQDVVLLYKLNQTLRTIPLMLKECVWTGSFMDRFYIGELLDNFILRGANQQNFHLHTRPGWKENNEAITIRGGYVMEPKTGLYNNLRILDVKSMYPSMIVGWNIGQESLVQGEISINAARDFYEWLDDRKVEEVEFTEWNNFLKQQNKKYNPDNKYIQAGNNQFFKKDKQSIVAGLVQRLLEERKQYKKLQIDAKYKSIEYNNAQASQEAVKEMANCLHPETLLFVHEIETDKYINMKISEIEQSDKSYEIQSFNFSIDKVEWKKINKIWKTKYSGYLKKIKINDVQTIMCTPEHRLFLNNPNNRYVSEKILKKAEKIRKSDLLKTLDETLAFPEDIKNIKYSGDVYDLEIEDNHNFYIDNILSHNSMYGITADKQSRFFDSRVAEAITMTGQLMIRTSIHIVETKMKHPAIYADTDSVFTIVDDDKEMETLTSELNERLSNYLVKRFGVKENTIILEYEKKFRRFLMLDKKRYSGHLTEIDGQETDNLLSKGTENVRKNTIEYSRAKINELLDLILKQDKDARFIKKWIKEAQREVLEEDIAPEDLAITMKISKPISSYKSKPPHVRLAEEKIKKNEILETQEGKHVWGQKIEYIMDGSKKTDKDAIGAVSIEDFTGEWDREYYWDVQVWAPMERIVKAAWPERDWDRMFNLSLKEKIRKRAEIEQKRIEREAEKERKKLEYEEKKKEKRKKKEKQERKKKKKRKN